MSWVAALSVVAAFVIVARLLRLPALAREAVGRTRRALCALRDPSLDERGRERALRSHAGHLLLLAVAVALLASTAAAAPIGALALLDRLGALDQDDVLAVLGSPPFLAATAVILGAASLLRRRRRP